MHELHRELDRNGDLRGAILSLSERLYSHPLRQGLILDLNPIWLAAYRIDAAGLSRELLGDDFDPILGRAAPVLDAIGIERDPRGEVDYGRRFDSATRWTRMVFGYKKEPLFTPYLVRIIARPVLVGEEKLFDARAALSDIARDAPFPAVVETRAPARLILAAGGSLTTSRGLRGTLGGFLQDLDGDRHYAATCGHVLDVGERIAGEPNLAPCVHAWRPVVLEGSSRCYAGCTTMTRLDLALVELPDPIFAANDAKAVAEVVYQGDLVEMHGGASGARRYRVGGACVGYEIGGACWDRLYELRPPIRSGVVPPGVQVMASPPPDNGNSGAWVIRDRNDWCGVVVAADELFGYAISAGVVLDEASAALGVPLALA